MNGIIWASALSHISQWSVSPASPDAANIFDEDSETFFSPQENTVLDITLQEARPVVFFGIDSRGVEIPVQVQVSLDGGSYAILGTIFGGKLKLLQEVTARFFRLILPAGKIFRLYFGEKFLDFSHISWNFSLAPEKVFSISKTLSGKSFRRLKYSIMKYILELQYISRSDILLLDQASCEQSVILLLVSYPLIFGMIEETHEYLQESPGKFSTNLVFREQ